MSEQPENVWIGFIQQYRDQAAARRARVLRHPEVAAKLCQWPLEYTDPAHWTGFIPPATTDGGRKAIDTPARRALIAICQEVVEREKRPEPPADPITPKQLTKLQILMAEGGLEERDDRLAFASEELGRPVGSTKHLTKDEAARLIDLLDNLTTTGGDREPQHDHPTPTHPDRVGEDPVGPDPGDPPY